MSFFTNIKNRIFGNSQSEQKTAENTSAQQTKAPNSVYVASTSTQTVQQSEQNANLQDLLSGSGSSPAENTGDVLTVSSNNNTQTVKNVTELVNWFNKELQNNNIKLTEEQVEDVAHKALGDVASFDTTPEQFEASKEVLVRVINKLKSEKIELTYENIAANIDQIRLNKSTGVADTFNPSKKSYSERIEKIMNDRNCTREEALEFLVDDIYKGANGLKTYTYFEELKILAKNRHYAMKNGTPEKANRSVKEISADRAKQTWNSIMSNASEEELKEFFGAVEKYIDKCDDTGVYNYFHSLEEISHEGANRGAADEIHSEYYSTKENRAHSEHQLARVRSGQGSVDASERTKNDAEMLAAIMHKLENNEALTKDEEKLLRRHDIEPTYASVQQYYNNEYAQTQAAQTHAASCNVNVNTDDLAIIIENNTCGENSRYVISSVNSYVESGNQADMTISKEAFTQIMDNVTNGNYTIVVNDIHNGTTTALNQPRGSQPAGQTVVSSTVNSNAAETETVQEAIDAAKQEVLKPTFGLVSEASAGAGYNNEVSPVKFPQAQNTNNTENNKQAKAEAQEETAVNNQRNYTTSVSGSSSYLYWEQKPTADCFSSVKAFYIATTKFRPETLIAGAFSKKNNPSSEVQERAINLYKQLQSDKKMMVLENVHEGAFTKLFNVTPAYVKELLKKRNVKMSSFALTQQVKKAGEKIQERNSGKEIQKRNSVEEIQKRNSVEGIQVKNLT